MIETPRHTGQSRDKEPASPDFLARARKIAGPVMIAAASLLEACSGKYSKDLPPPQGEHLSVQKDDFDVFAALKSPNPHRFAKMPDTGQKTALTADDLQAEKSEVEVQQEVNKLKNIN